MGSFSYKRNFYFRFLPEVFFWTEAFPVNVNMTAAFLSTLVVFKAVTSELVRRADSPASPRPAEWEQCLLTRRLSASDTRN